MINLILFQRAITTFIVVIALTFPHYSIANSKGYEYHSEMRKARSYGFLNNDTDSTFYFYEKAISNGVFYFKDHEWAITGTILTNRLDKCRYYIELGAEKGMSWNNLNFCFSYAKFINNYVTKRGDTLHTYDPNLKLTDIIPRFEYKIHHVQIQPNKSLLKFFKKIDRRDNKGNRKTRNPYSLYLRDSVNHSQILQIIEHYGKIPTIYEAGEEAHEILSVCIIHMGAKQILTLLPYLIKAINNGTYYFNEDLAYAIDINAFYMGDYIVTKGNDFNIFSDTTNKIDNDKFCSYLGELYFPFWNIESENNKKFAISEMNPNISIYQINLMREKLCLENYFDHLKHKNISIANSNKFKQILQQFY